MAANWFQNILSRVGGQQGNSSSGFMGTNIPTLPQFVSGLFSGGGESRARDFANTYGNDLTQSSGDRLDAQMWGKPLMASAQDSPESGDPNEHPSQLRPSGATVTRFGAAPSSARGAANFGYSGDTASGARGTIGMGVRQGTLEGVQAMLGTGLSKRPLMPRHEINDERAEAKANGMTLHQYRNQS